MQLLLIPLCLLSLLLLSQIMIEMNDSHLTFYALSFFFSQTDCTRCEILAYVLNVSVASAYYTL